MKNFYAVKTSPERGELFAHGDAFGDGYSYMSGVPQLFASWDFANAIVKDYKAKSKACGKPATRLNIVRVKA